MGAACSDVKNPEGEAEAEAKKVAKARSRQLEGQIAKAYVHDQSINKLLLLGTGESGKSTLFKQIISIYGKGYPETERKVFAPIIYNNIILSMKTLCQESVKYGQVQKAAKQAKQLFLEELKGDEDVGPELAEHIATLWADPAIQATFLNRAHFQVLDSASYFFDKIVAIGAEDYLPTEQDVLRSRIRTTGIVENEFIVDVGGQRNERKKWMHCFENVTAVLFVEALSAYDQVLFEDETMNRMVESLNLFEEICNSRWFRETSIILFLNKRDLFAEKIRKVALSQYFAGYKGGADYDAAVSYIEKQFTDRNRNPDKTIYCHVTCATDTGNVKVVFEAVKEIVIRKSLTEVLKGAQNALAFMKDSGLY